VDSSTQEGVAAKMAEIAADLPKWQAEQMLCQITKYYSAIFFD
jgi:hypothetical protein